MHRTGLRLVLIKSWNIALKSFNTKLKISVLALNLCRLFSEIANNLVIYAKWALTH